MNIAEFDGVLKFKFKSGDTDTHAVRLRELDWLAPKISANTHCLEFGVFSGTTINRVASLRPDLHFDGFDSFEGLPEDWDMGQKHVKKEAFDKGGELPEVEENVRLWKGWFNDTIPEWKRNQEVMKPIGYLHIDCDIYSSTVTILEELDELILPGAIIRFDELCCWRYAFGEASPRGEANRVYYTTWKQHEWKALNEWMEKYNRRVMPVCRNWFQSGTVIVTQ
jgi:hypothetical protein